MVTKHVLFYSNYCKYSNEVLSLITKRNLKDMFILVCVDNTNLKLPTFVDRVPLICTTRKQIFMDESLMDFLNSQGDLNENVEGWGDLKQQLGTISDQFSFIGEDDEQPMFNKNYVYIGNEQHIECPQDLAQGEGKLDSKMVENFITQRENEYKMMKSNPRT